MTELQLDGFRAIIKEGSSIKLSLENIYFTKSSSYTYDVELPLNIPENRKIFGNINRRDIEKEAKRLSAALSADGVRLLTGEAIVTKVSDSSVTVQLLGYLSANNYGNRVEKIYIDEIDMGDWYNTSYGNIPGPSMTGSAYPIAARYMTDALGGSVSYDRFINAFYGGDNLWVAYPIMNTNTETVHNEIVFRQYRDSPDGPVMLRLEQPYSTPGGLHNGQPQVKMAVQPFVWVMAQKIAGYTGMKLNMADNALYTDPFLRRIFLANANNRIECSKCLPHWTVNDWWEQIERTFGIVVVLDDQSGYMMLRKRSDFYGDNTETTYLDNIVDTFSIDVNDESKSDISVCNTGFADFNSSAHDRLPDNILQSATVNRDYDSLEDMLEQCGNSVTDYDSGTIYECKDGRRYIIDNEGSRLIEVDMLRDRITDKSGEIDIEIKFVPISFIKNNFKVCYRWKDGEERQDFALDAMGFGPRVEFDIMQRPDRTDSSWELAEEELTDSPLDIAAEIKAIDNGEDISEKEDSQSGESLAYIAIASGSHRDDALYGDGEIYICQCPRPFIAESRSLLLSQPTKIMIKDPGASLSLVNQSGVASLGAAITASPVKINTRIKHCFSFISSKVPNPNGIFVIQNRRYVCEKIEIGISSEGIDRKITGYFYPLS